MFKGRLAEFDFDEPAEIRVLVRLPEANHFSDVDIIGALQVLEHDMEPAMQFTEVERYSATPADAVIFYRFEHIFNVNSSYDLRVNFYVNTYINLRLTKEPIGSATVQLTDIIHATNEKREVQLLSPEGDRRLNMNAEFALEYARLLSAMLCIEIRVKVDKTKGWPFDTVRVFFVLFRWDPTSQATWTALYRSEVLVKPTDHPGANGFMVFQEVQKNLKQAIDGVNDDRPLRLEFFQYQEGQDGLLLGYFTTSLRHLRQQKSGNELNIQVNTYPQGELIGKLHMVTSRVTMKRHYFSLQMEFGGVVEGDFVYFDIVLSEETRGTLWKGHNSQRPFYKIVRYSDQGKWEEVYRSETPSLSRSSKRRYKFKVAKLSERKLAGGKSRSSFLIVFSFEDLSKKEVPAGHFQTTIEELTGAKPGHVFPLKSPDDSKAYFRILQAERGDLFTYFAAQCVLGSSEPGQSSSFSKLSISPKERKLV